MITNPLTAGTEETPTLYYLLQRATCVYNMSNTVTNLYRIINYPIINPQHNDIIIIIIIIIGGAEPNP
jgi:hypothetical protein